MVRFYRKRLGGWWNTPSVYEAWKGLHNRAIIVAERDKHVRGFIILQRWGSKGLWKGHCKSLVTVSEEKGVGTLLQSLLPIGTIGYVSERNHAQIRVMEKSGYSLISFTEEDKKLKRRMGIWLKEQNPRGYLRSVQKNLEQKLRNMDK
jgi:hypothetical protein